MSTPIDRDKLRSIGVISRRTGSRVTEGRQHPETGKPYKATTDELGGTVTEHSTGRAPGVSHRQDANVRPQLVRAQIGAPE